jgi:hypothetical protein
MNYRDFLQKVIYAIINPLIKGMIAVGDALQKITGRRIPGQYRGSRFLPRCCMDARN